MSKPAILVLFTVSTLAACGPRDPGPLESERNEVTYWKVLSSDIAYASCTDDPSVRDAIKPPAIEPNSYLTYKVSADGLSAVAQHCDTTQPSSCRDSSTGVVFAVTGHQLIWDPWPLKKAVSGSACSLQTDERWIVEDGGETGTFTVELGLDLVDSPTDCDSLEASLKARSPNGLGYVGCVIRMTMALEFYR